MKISEINIDLKSLIIGSIITVIFTIIGSHGGSYEFAYPFAAIGLLYAGYHATIKTGAIMGIIASIPLIILGYYGIFGIVSNFILLTIAILLVGAFVGFIGAYAKKNREKAKAEYEKKQKRGKKKKKK